MPDIKDFLPSPPWDGPPLPRVLTSTRAWYWHKELRDIESRLNILREEILTFAPQLTGDKRDMAYRLDDEVRQALEHLSASVRIAGPLAFELERGAK
jgi:hypothetical protein